MATATVPERPAQAGSARSHLPFIMALGFVARVVFAAHVLQSEPAKTLPAWNYEDIFIAISLIHGGGYASPFGYPSGPTAILAPGYPLLLAGLIRFTGTGHFAVYALIGFQIFLSLLIIPLVMWVARRYFGRRTANLAGFIYAVSEPMLVLPLYIWDTTLSALLLMAAIAWASCPRWKERWYSVASGAGCAIATLVNPTLLPSLCLVFGWSAWRSRVLPWLAALTFLIIFSPWPIRNLRVMHSFIPFRSTFSYELWEGNHPGGNGDVVPNFWPLTNPQERALYLANGEVGYMRIKGSLVKAYISTHKVEFARFTMRRIVRFWIGASDMPGPMTVMLALLAFSGMVLSWREARSIALLALPIAIYPLPFYITHPNGRYQFILDPLLAIFAAYACESFFAWCAHRSAPSPTLAASN